ncbi:hypothetical protein PR048_004059 [Dryococelus australis]|uniref:Uncharacterized protein n=1 Tax=Dryococelus australis TaxID=614101 RepID=A0ABQ9I593_9NEOP|nr:hypothetical protein PR048_004059 [Dryococelus australis]
MQYDKKSPHSTTDHQEGYATLQRTTSTMCQQPRNIVPNDILRSVPVMRPAGMARVLLPVPLHSLQPTNGECHALRSSDLNPRDCLLPVRPSQGHRLCNSSSGHSRASPEIGTRFFSRCVQFLEDACSNHRSAASLLVHEHGLHLLELECVRMTTVSGAAVAVAERLACLPLTKANWVQSPAGSLPDFRLRESCMTMPLVSGFSRGSPVFPPPFHSGIAPHFPRSPSSALRTSLLRAAQISSLHLAGVVLHWLLQRCEDTPSLTELHVIEAHNCEVFLYWCRVTQAMRMESCGLMEEGTGIQKICERFQNTSVEYTKSCEAAGNNSLDTGRMAWNPKFAFTNIEAKFHDGRPKSKSTVLAKRRQSPHSFRHKQTDDSAATPHLGIRVPEMATVSSSQPSLPGTRRLSPPFTANLSYPPEKPCCHETKDQVPITRFPDPLSHTTIYTTRRPPPCTPHSQEAPGPASARSI